MKKLMKQLYIFCLVFGIGTLVPADNQVEWESSLPEERAKVLFVDENRLYALGGPYSIPYSTLYCLDAQNGEIKWRFYIEVSEDVFDPFIFRDNIYWGTESGAFYALGKQDGSLRWAFALEGKYSVKNVRYKGKFLLHEKRTKEIVFLDLLQGDISSAYKNPDLRWRNTVRVWNYLFYGTDSKDLVCIHAGTGRMIWKIFENLRTGPFQGDEAVYYGSTLETFFCLHPLNGVRKWVSVWFPQELCEKDGITAVRSGKRKILLLETSTGKVLRDVTLPHRTSGLTISGGSVYTADYVERTVFGFDVETGKQQFVYTVPPFPKVPETAENTEESGDSESEVQAEAPVKENFNFFVQGRWLYFGNYDGKIYKINPGMK